MTFQDRNAKAPGVNSEIDQMRQLMETALKLGFLDDARYWHQEIKWAEARDREAQA